MEIRFPWEDDAEPAPSPTPAHDVEPRPRGRRPRALEVTHDAAGWLYHHLTISGPADRVAAFAAAARGAGVIPWRLNVARIEEDAWRLPSHRRSGA